MNDGRFVVPNNLRRKARASSFEIECTDRRWLPPSAKPTERKQTMTMKTGIVIHHSHGEPDQLKRYESTMANAFDWKSLKRFHVEDEHRKYNDIGYAFGIAPGGRVLIGRSAQIDGAQCLGHNKDTIGVCLVGDFSVGYAPFQQWMQATQFTGTLCMLFNITPLNVRGHGEMSGAHTECPGKYFDMEMFRAHLAGHMATMTGHV